MCWGFRPYGQLGNGAFSTNFIPTSVIRGLLLGQSTDNFVKSDSEKTVLKYIESLRNWTFEIDSEEEDDEEEDDDG